MARFFIQLMYNGTRFHGWQIQPNAITVQEEVSKCISLLLKQNVDIYYASTTNISDFLPAFFANILWWKEIF